jgi:eukaryotic-like serine/threonine-protein kinase
VIPQGRRPSIPFGKYVLFDRINSGSTAEVWRAKVFGAGGFAQIVAIKRLLPHLLEDEESIAAFIDEARIGVQLSHPHVARLLEMGNIANSYFIAMEYVLGKDLRTLFDHARSTGEPLPIPLVAYCVSRLCEGLHYIHCKKDAMGRDLHIVHRGLCLEDVLVSFGGDVKVIDFGLARASGRVMQTLAGIIKGKPGYMSPEQARGLPLDRRSDIFSIGVCLYELLTGKRLSESDDAPSLHNRHIEKPLERIILRALARDVDARYQDASELSEDLKPFCTAEQPGVDREKHFFSGDGAVFGRNSLAQYLQFAYAEDVEREKQLIAECVALERPGLANEH